MQMGRIENKEVDTVKSKLVMEICYISSLTIQCSHTNNFSKSNKKPFIDWYRLLGVEENAGLDVIRKKYHKLALQLHPDKNKHPKAEFAFKIVSEAYACLSDNTKRKAFNLEKSRHLCLICNRLPYKTTSLRNSTSSKKSASPILKNDIKSQSILRSLKDIRDRFKEETRVIENCLRAHELLKNESTQFIPSKGFDTMNIKDIPTFEKPKESPVFDPSHYMFHGYPHVRTQVSEVGDGFWALKRRSFVNCQNGKGRYETPSPIFEIKTGSRMMSRSRSVYLRY